MSQDFKKNVLFSACTMQDGQFSNSFCRFDGLDSERERERRVNEGNDYIFNVVQFH